MMEKEGEVGEPSVSGVQSREEERSKSVERKDKKEEEEVHKSKKKKKTGEHERKRKRKSLADDDKEEQERKRKKLEEEAKSSEPTGPGFKYVKYSSKAIEAMVDGLPEKVRRRTSFVVEPFQEIIYNETEKEELLRETKEYLFKTNEGYNQTKKYLSKHLKRKLKVTHSNKHAIFRAFLDQMLRDAMSFSSTNFKNQVCHCIVYNYDLFEASIEEEHNMTVGQYVINILQDKMFKSFVPICEAIAHLLGQGVAIVHLGNLTEDPITLCGCEQIHDAKLVIATNEDMSHFMATGNNSNKFNLLVSWLVS